MVESCVKVVDLLKVEKNIIEKNLDRHKWFKHIADSNMAMIDFIKTFGGVLKEMYCEACCPFCDQCEVYKKMIEDLNKK
jgi:hypothetical protein